MKFGETRYGPLAPCAFQFGKYDVFTSTGLPISDTWKEILSTPSCRRLTCDGVIDRSFVLASCEMSMCFQSFGPDAANSLESSDRLFHHGALAHSHASSRGSELFVSGHFWPQQCEYVPPCVVATTGSSLRPTASGEFLTS